MLVEEILLGAALDLIVGLTGAGGAALALPGMIFLLGMPTVIPTATAFPFTAIIKVFGSFQHVWQGSVHWGVTADLLIGSLAGTVAGVFGRVDFRGKMVLLWLKHAQTGRLFGFLLKFS
jgi:uncharacterized membrane protein YfcA